MANIALKGYAEDDLQQLKPTYIALDNTQIGNHSVGEIVHM